MECGVVGCRGCAECEGPGDDARVDLMGASEGIGRWCRGIHGRLGVAEGGFEWEGVGGEPVEEGGLAENAGIGVLGRVDVCVCEIRGVRMGVQGYMNLMQDPATLLLKPMPICSTVLAPYFCLAAGASVQLRTQRSRAATSYVGL